MRSTLRRGTRRCLTAAASLALLLLASPASAAEFTDLLDAADDFDDMEDSTWDPFDFNLELGFQFDSTSGKVTREAPCVPNTDGESDLVKNNPRLVVDEGRCSEPALVYNKELLYSETRSTLNIALRAALYKDLELRLDVPYVISLNRGFKYANESQVAGNNVDATNSSIDPRADCNSSEQGRCVRREAENVFEETDNPEEVVSKFDAFGSYKYFGVNDDYTTFNRAGFGDPSLTLGWAPFNDQRDDTKATLFLSMGYLMPIAPIQTRENLDAVGRGVHELNWRIAGSKKFNWIEPYFGIQYFLPLPASDSLYQQRDPFNSGQVFINPPMRGTATIGTEFIPHEDPATGARYAIDLRFSFGYTSEGRDYSPVFDHMARSNCNGKTVQDVLPQWQGGQITNPEDVACAWIVQQPGNADPNPVYDLGESVRTMDDSPYFTDGLMTVEAYATFSGLIGFYIQPMRNFQLKALAMLTHQQEHFMTNARTGRDADDTAEETSDDTVDLQGADAALERNPNHNPTYDSSGNRFRIQEFNTWTVLVNAALQF